MVKCLRFFSRNFIRFLWFNKETLEVVDIPQNVLEISTQRVSTWFKQSMAEVQSSDWSRDPFCWYLGGEGGVLGRCSNHSCPEKSKTSTTELVMARVGYVELKTITFYIKKCSTRCYYITSRMWLGPALLRKNNLNCHCFLKPSTNIEHINTCDI